MTASTYKIFGPKSTHTYAKERRTLSPKAITTDPILGEKFYAKRGESRVNN